MEGLKHILLISILLAFVVPVSHGQVVKKDTVSLGDTVLLKHSPKKAVIFSTILPGMGQVYNQKYWKVPIIYAGIGSLIYFIGDYNKKYKTYYNAYNDYVLYTTNPSLPNQKRYNNIRNLENFTDKTYFLKSYKDFYRRWRDLDVLILAGVYFLNIIDANVDAHFFYFDISDDLTLNVKPIIFEPLDNKNRIGISIGMRF